MGCYLSKGCRKFDENDCPDKVFCIRKFKEDSLFDLGLVEDNQRIDFPLYVYSNDPPEEYQAFSYLNDICLNIESFINSGKNLYLYSTTCGNGKTAWSLRLLRSYVDKIWISSEITCRVLYISVPKFLLELKANISNHSQYIEHIYKHVRTTDLVIWDDIGSKCGTEFEIENMLSLINNRLDAGKSNIYTSNIPPEMLSQVLGPRLGSRVVGMSEVVQLRGGDKRGLKV